MKPLLAKDLNSFLQRFQHFENGEFGDIDILSSTKIRISISAQDSARAFDWVSVALEFSGVKDAQLLDASKLQFVDMSQGITILYENATFAFGISKCENLSRVKTSSCFIISTDVKYEERMI